MLFNNISNSSMQVLIELEVEFEWQEVEFTGPNHFDWSKMAMHLLYNFFLTLLLQNDE